MPSVFSKFRRTHSGVFFKLLMKIVYIFISHLFRNFIYPAVIF